MPRFPGAFYIMQFNKLDNTIKTPLLAIGLFVALIFAANFNYFWKNFGYDIGFKKIDIQSNFAVVPSDKLSTTTPNTLTIPSLNIVAPIVYAEKANETSFQKALLSGVGHYPGTADPGQYGNSFIFGHSSDYVWSKGKYKTVFALLPRIKVGDEIKVSDKRGIAYTYVVKSTLIVKPTETKYLKQDTSKKVLTLQTSWPIGTALKRFLVIAEIK